MDLALAEIMLRFFLLMFVGRLSAIISFVRWFTSTVIFIEASIDAERFVSCMIAVIIQHRTEY